MPMTAYLSRLKKRKRKNKHWYIGLISAEFSCEVIVFNLSIDSCPSALANSASVSGKLFKVVLTNIYVTSYFHAMSGSRGVPTPTAAIPVWFLGVRKGALQSLLVMTFAYYGNMTRWYFHAIKGDLKRQTVDISCQHVFHTLCMYFWCCMT